jgi:putative NADH-flavin reductase
VKIAGEQRIVKTLMVGAFENIGKAVIEEAHKRHHEIIVFEIDSKRTPTAARQF